MPNRIIQPSLLYRVQPFCCFGQSEIAGGYRPATDWPAQCQVAQKAAFCYNLFCHHQEANPTGAYARNDAWHRLQPWQMGTSGEPTPVSGPLVGSLLLDLGESLSLAGIQAAIAAYCIGGTSMAYWTPSATGSQYAAIKTWCAARLAELVAPKAPIGIIAQFESGRGTGITNWNTNGFAVLKAQAATDLGITKWIIIVSPTSYPAYDADLAAEEFSAGAADPSNVTCVQYNSTTFVTDPGPSGLHWDAASGRQVARLVADAAKTLLGI